MPIAYHQCLKWVIVLALKNETASWVNLVNIRQQKDWVYKQSYLAGHSPLINKLNKQKKVGGTGTQVEAATWSQHAFGRWAQNCACIFACLLLTHTFINGATENLELVVRVRNMLGYDGFAYFEELFFHSPDIDDSSSVNYHCIIVCYSLSSLTK